jgi:para-nitrobenzyl esterase
MPSAVCRALIAALSLPLALFFAFVGTRNPALVGRPWPAMRAGMTQVMAFGQTQGLRPAISTPERLAAWRAYAASGVRLGLM